jgi:hypothetical protein
MPLDLVGTSLVAGERLLLAELDPGLSVEADATGVGAFLRARASRSASRLLFTAGRLLRCSTSHSGSRCGVIPRGAWSCSRRQATRAGRKRFQRAELSQLDHSSALPCSLGEREFELFWLTPIERGLALLGLANKLNGPAAVRDLERAPRCAGSHWRTAASCSPGRSARRAASKPRAAACRSVTSQPRAPCAWR